MRWVHNNNETEGKSETSQIIGVVGLEEIVDVWKSDTI